MVRSVIDVVVFLVSHCNLTGERRIRVITLALPTTQNISELYASADQVAIATLLANKAVERALTHKLEDSREFVFQRLVELLVAYKANMTSGGAGASAQLAIGENMKMLPVLVLGLLKNVSSVFRFVVMFFGMGLMGLVCQVGIRQSAQIPPDIRAYSQALLTSLPSQLLIPYIHPTFYSLHNMPPEVRRLLLVLFIELTDWERRELLVNMVSLCRLRCR